jgi:hypothetical protein
LGLRMTTQFKDFSKCNLASIESHHLQSHTMEVCTVGHESCQELATSFFHRYIRLDDVIFRRNISALFIVAHIDHMLCRWVCFIRLCQTAVSQATGIVPNHSRWGKY